MATFHHALATQKCGGSQLCCIIERYCRTFGKGLILSSQIEIIRNNKMLLNSSKKMKDKPNQMQIFKYIQM